MTLEKVEKTQNKIKSDIIEIVKGRNKSEEEKSPIKKYQNTSQTARKSYQIV